MTTSWHWQERFDALDPEDACRRQVLKVTKRISFDEWLQHKKQESRQKGESLDQERQDEKATPQECDERFREWVKKKQRKQRQSGQLDKTTVSRKDQPFVKPPSLHVNPITKHSCEKESHTSKHVPQAATTKKRSPPEQNAAVFAEWERRKKREDRVKRKHAQLNRQLQEHAQRLLHLTRWKRKDVVCAYSTNHRSPSLPFPNATLWSLKQQ